MSRAILTTLGLFVALVSPAFAQTPPLEPSFATPQERQAFWARQNSPSTEALPAGWQRRHAGRDGWIVERIPTVLNSPPPDECPQNQVRPYPNTPCVGAPAPGPVDFAAGRCYAGPYHSTRLIVTGVEGQIVSYAWLPHSGSNTTGAGTFAANSPVVPLGEIACPWAVTR